MSTRKVVTASVAALACAAMSVPVVNAQDTGAQSGSLPVSGLSGGSLEGASLSGVSSGGQDGEGAGEAAGEGAGSAGSLEAPGSGGDGLSALVPENDMMCELPELGGSVAKFYPLLGISGVPTGVIDLITSALDSFPNLIELVAGEGAGAALLWQTGSLSEGLCTSILGGTMVMPPETVYVDPDGQPTSTVTGTPVPGAGSSGSSGSVGSDASGTSEVTEDATPDGVSETAGATRSSELSAPDGPDSGTAPSTTVPVP